MNRLYPAAKHPEAITRQLIRGYAEMASLQIISERTGLTERQVGRVTTKLRQHVAAEFVRIKEQVRASDRWKQQFENLTRQLSIFVQAQMAGLLEHPSQGKVRLRPPNSDTNEQEVTKVMRDTSGDAGDVFALLAASAVSNMEKAYVQYWVQRRRGVVSEHLSELTSELQARFSVFLLYKYGVPEMIGEKHIRKADGSLEAIVEKPNFDKLFSVNEEQASYIETCLLEYIENNPIQ